MRTSEYHSSILIIYTYIVLYAEAKTHPFAANLKASEDKKAERRDKKPEPGFAEDEKSSGNQVKSMISGLFLIHLYSGLDWENYIKIQEMFCWSQIMINGDLKAFLEDVYLGLEVWFVYKGVKFFIQGWNDSAGKCIMTLQQMNPPGEGYMFFKKGDDRFSLVEELLNTPFFEGKTFWEIEPETEWVD